MPHRHIDTHPQRHFNILWLKFWTDGRRRRPRLPLHACRSMRYVPLRDPSPMSRSLVSYYRHVHFIPPACIVPSSLPLQLHSQRRTFASSGARHFTMDEQARDIRGNSHACSSPGPKRSKRAYIALGSNLGDRVDWIEKACNELDRRGIKIKRTSSLWETEPMYVLGQDRFVNGACEVCRLASVGYVRVLADSVPRSKLISSHYLCSISYRT
jgi:7,8-dihydro-6-hydroxymethylpterin-pyrophosphokinase (HPPK)